MSTQANRLNKVEAEQDIRDFLSGCYYSNCSSQLSQEETDQIEANTEGTDYFRWWQLSLSQEEADQIAANSRTTEGSPGSPYFANSRSAEETAYYKLMQRLISEGKSAGARYIAARINSGSAADLKQLAQDWWCHRAIKQELSAEEVRQIGATLSDLRRLGIKTGYQARRFYNLYKEVRIKNRVWNSSKQVDQKKVLAVANTPNYNRLPLWVKKGLIEHAHYIWTERVGNIWRLPDCVRAWRWCSALPKGIAEKIGRMSVKGRVIATLAWRNASNYASLWDCSLWDWRESGWKIWNPETHTVDISKTRHELVNEFWTEFRRLEKMPLIGILPQILDEWDYEHELSTVRRIVEEWLGLPYQALKDEFPTRCGEAESAIIEIIATYGNSKDACQHLFGVNDKATVKAFRQCQSKKAWRWASALAQAPRHAVQKILKMENLIEWQPDAVDFLMTLPMISRLRMLESTHFKYRGQVCPISPDHVRDTGYFWTNIRTKPRLGRVRCWFSVHEMLAAAFVKELPDEALPVPTGWKRVDGLCAVDNSWKIEFPKRVATLKYYGEIFHNCVGGYGPAIKSNRSVVFVVREQGQLTHCVEFDRDGDCNQFYQAGNSDADYSIKTSVIAALEQAGLA